MRILGAVAAILLSTAPFQCASEPDPNRAIEDSAPRSLWLLAERFAAQGDTDARRETLSYLVERYPSSRYARRAEAVLGPARAEEPDGE